MTNEITLISVNDACKLTSMSRTMLNKYRDQGRFPVPVQLGERRLAFVRAEVIDWIADRVSKRAAK